MPAAKSGGGKMAKDPGKGPAVNADPSNLKAQHGQLSSENAELKELRGQLLAKEKAMREKIEKLRKFAAATGRQFKPTPFGGMGLEAPKLKSMEPRVSTPHTPMKPKLLKGFSPAPKAPFERRRLKGLPSPKKSYKPLKIPVKVPKIKPSGDPELDKLRREAAILEAQNAVLARQRSGLRRGVKTLADDKHNISQNMKSIHGGYKGKRRKLKQILAKHNKYRKKGAQLEQRTGRKLEEIQRAFEAKGLEFPNALAAQRAAAAVLASEQRQESSPPKRRGMKPRASRGQRASRDVLRGRQHKYSRDMRGMAGLEARLSPTTPRRGAAGKMRAPRRNRSKSLPRAHTQSYLRSRDRRHHRPHHNLSKNSYSRSRRMSRQRDRPSEVDVPRRNSLQDLRRVPNMGKSVDDDALMQNSRKRIQADLQKRMRNSAQRGGGNELPQLEAYSSLPDLRASSERNYMRGDENQPLSRVTEEPNKASADATTTLTRSKAAMGYGLNSTRRLMNALKELSPNAGRLAARLQNKRSKARRKSIQRAKKKKRAKAANKAVASSVPTEAGRKENIVYSQSLNNLGLAGERGRGERSLLPRGALDEKTSYSAKDFDTLWGGRLRGLLPPARPTRSSAARSLLRSASQQRVRETPGKDKVSRRHSLGAFDFESLYTRKSPRAKRRNKNKERSKSVHHGRAPGPGGREDKVLEAARHGRGKLRSKSSEGFRNNLGQLKIALPGKKGAGSRVRGRGGYRDPLDEAMSDFRKLTPENFESKYKKLHKRVKKGLVRDKEEKPRYDEFVSSLKAGTRNRIAASKKASYLKGRTPGSPSQGPMPSYKKRNNDWWQRMNNLKDRLKDAKHRYDHLGGHRAAIQEQLHHAQEVFSN